MSCRALLPAHFLVSLVAASLRELAAQGNVDPMVLFADEKAIAAAVRDCVAKAGRARPHPEPWIWRDSGHPRGEREIHVRPLKNAHIQICSRGCVAQLGIVSMRSKVL